MMGTLMVLHLLILITMYKSSSLILMVSSSVSLAVVQEHGSDHAPTYSSGGGGGGGGLRIDPITQIDGGGMHPMDYDNNPPNVYDKKSFDMEKGVHDPNDPQKPLNEKERQVFNKSKFVEEESVNDPYDPPKTYTKKRNFVGRVYEVLFRVTHARLHPVHYRPTRVLVVDQTGRGNSRTVQGAIDMVNLDNKWRIQIIIRPGVYREKVHVPARKPFITFQGSGSAKTVITWNARASDRGQSGGILGTFDSASVAIDSDYFVARDITFQNTAPKPLPGAQGMQAVALRISGDKAAFVDCRILGAQDTLFDHMGRHFFLRCYIEGAIDFIFGDGRSLYLNCELHANAVSYGAIAASQRNGIEENTGFSFVQCRVTGTGLLYLGRAWGQYARIVFAYCYFDDIIIPDAWYDWGDTSRRETVFFGEYKCWGPGAQPRWRVSWSRQLSYAEARPFLGIGFINGHKWFNILT